MPLNIAHRGARGVAPENTMAAARKALTFGADLWETDIAVTKDDELILFHDDSLARTTNAAAVIKDRAITPFSDFTLAELRRLDAGSWFAAADPHGAIAAGEVSQEDLASYRGEKIPTLREALEFTLASRWKVNLEIKRQPAAKADFPMVKRLLALVDELGAGPETVIFSSGQHHWLEEIRRSRPEFEVQALLGLFPENPIAWRDKKFDTYNVRCTRTTPAEVSEMAKAGLKVNLYTVNEPADMKAWAAAGAAGLITDFPQRLKSALS